MLYSISNKGQLFERKCRVKLNNHLPELITEFEKKVGRYVNGRIGSTKLDIEYKLCIFFSDKLNRDIRRDDLFSFEFEETA